MRSHTPTNSKSPFAINRKSQIANTSSFLEGNENSKSTLNLRNHSPLFKSRPGDSEAGPLAEVIPKDSLRNFQRSASRQMELQIRIKDKIISDLEKFLEQKQGEVNTIEAERDQLAAELVTANASNSEMSSVNQHLERENLQLRKQMCQQGKTMQSAVKSIAQLSSSLQVYSSLDPRLKELEELQDRLIQENSLLKQQKDKLSQRVRSMMKSMREGRRPDLRQLEQLMSQL